MALISREPPSRYHTLSTDLFKNFIDFLLTSTFFSSPVPPSHSSLSQGLHVLNLLRRSCLFLLFVCSMKDGAVSSLPASLNTKITMKKLY